MVVGGRYGLASKEFTPSHAASVFENLGRPAAKDIKRAFTVGIVDDVSHSHLPDSVLLPPGTPTLPTGTMQCVFWGMGSDGTVGANKEAIKLIADNTNLYTQV